MIKKNVIPDPEMNHVGHRCRLRERFLAAGIKSFSPHEVVELMLTLAIPRRDVKPLAKLLVNRFGSLPAILDATEDQLIEIPGVTRTSVFAFHFIRSLIPLYLEHTASQTSFRDQPDLLKDLLRARLAHEEREVFEVIHFDSGLRLLRDGIAKAKDDAIKAWCAQIGTQTATMWDYVRINQSRFDARPCEDFAGLVASIRQSPQRELL